MSKKQDGGNAHDDPIELIEALERSVKLQSHYAWLLNQYDGGNRIGFVNADEWLQRLATLRGTK
jgi:hypothetical protein